MKTIIIILAVCLVASCATGPSRIEQARTWLNQQYAEGRITPEMYMIGEQMIQERESEQRAAQLTAAAALMMQSQYMRTPKTYYPPTWGSGTITGPKGTATYNWFGY